MGKSQDISKDIFQLAVESATNHIIITDVEGIIIFANKAASFNTGYEISEMIGDTPRLWGHQMSLDFYKNLWKTIKVKLTPFHDEITNKKKNGELYITNVIITPIVKNGQLLGFIGAEEDITEKINEEEIVKKKILELENLNKLMINRELKMIELKKEIERLRSKLKQ